MSLIQLCENVPHRKTSKKQAKGHEEAGICGGVDSNSCKYWGGKQHDNPHVYQADQGEGDPEGGIVLRGVCRIFGV